MCMAILMSPTHHKHNMFVNDNEYIASGNKFINKLNVPVSIYLLLVVAMKVCSPHKH